MLKSTKTFLNFLFFIFSLAGFASIFLNDQINHELAMFIPTGLTVLYGMIIGGAVSNSFDYALVEHQIDTIYFMGFLYTLMSLVTLFYKLNGVLSVELDQMAISIVFTYLAISITTSIAGVIFRSLVKGSYLKNHPEEDVSLEKSYELLKSIADSFSTSYQDTFDSIKVYLDERLQTTASVDSKEKDYIEALDGFIRSTERFSRNLTEAEGKLVEQSKSFAGTLADQSDTIRNIAESGAILSGATLEIKNDLSALPMKEINQNLSQFRSETGELNLVLDSLVEIIEEKLEKVK